MAWGYPCVKVQGECLPLLLLPYYYDNNNNNFILLVTFDYYDYVLLFHIIIKGLSLKTAHFQTWQKRTTVCRETNQSQDTI